ncbi:hypothetical protein [Absidia glauca]|uniref:Uncharacterized protein n=1 Tax=Absidia glauca TaxID=4829 RepID=A0A163JIN2_ABSGL|nr:hypothetical protein [Absidia glauca]
MSQYKSGSRANKNIKALSQPPPRRSIRSTSASNSSSSSLSQPLPSTIDNKILPKQKTEDRQQEDTPSLDGNFEDTPEPISTPSPNAIFDQQNSLYLSVQMEQNPTPAASTPKGTTSISTSSSSSTNNTSDSDRDTKNTSRKESRRHLKGKVMKKKIAELDRLEAIIKDHSHADYKTLLQTIELKRQQHHLEAERRRELLRSSLVEQFNAERKSADDQFQLNKLSARKALMLELKNKINVLENERYMQACQRLNDEDINGDMELLAPLLLGLETDTTPVIPDKEASPTEEMKPS